MNSSGNLTTTFNIVVMNADEKARTTANKFRVVKGDICWSIMTDQSHTSDLSW